MQYLAAAIIINDPISGVMKTFSFRKAVNTFVVYFDDPAGLECCIAATKEKGIEY